jgi:hypothetical protein
MPERTVSQTFKVGGVLTQADSAKLSDPTGTFGIKRNDTSAVVVADGTNMSNPATGVYHYTFTAVFNVAYTAYIEFVYDGDTIYIAFDLPAVSTDFGMVASYNSLMERVGHELFGIRNSFSADQETDILQCIKDGLHYVYTAHAWSFFRPIREITTTAPYATGTVTVAAGVVTLVGGTFPSWAAVGVLRIVDDYYDVDTRDGNTQITLEDTSVTVAPASAFELGRPEYDLPVTFEAIAGDSDLTYEPGQADFYPAIRQRHDSSIRRMQQDNPYYDRPVCYSVRTVEFDPTVGSRKRLAFYPTPDAAYVLRVPMILRPTMIDGTNQYPVGGETLAQLIVEACLSAVELDFYEMKEGGRHTRRFLEMLPLAIQADQEKSAPTSLGPDMPRGEGYYAGVFDTDHWARAARMGSLTLDGDTL